MIDGHIHYASMLNPRKLNELIRRESAGKRGADVSE